MKNKLINPEKFWIQDPCILIKHFCKFNPFINSTFSNNLNAYTRLVIIITTVLFVITKSSNYIYLGLFLILIIIIIYYMFKPEKFVNTYFSNEVDNLLTAEKLPERTSNYFNTETLVNNPLKNTPITDYDKSQEYSKATVSNANMNEYIKGKMFQTPADFTFDTGTRQYYTMPNTLVPNDQGAFASWLYGTESNCKTGSIYMHRTGTPSESKLCTGFNVSVPTNFGNLNDYT